jgi:hypothetical protein
MRDSCESRDFFSWQGKDLHDNWNKKYKKLCNSMIELTAGKTGEL